MLTTHDLISKTFTTTRLREGYEMSEVDDFLERTTETLRHRDGEINDLRDQLAAGCGCPEITTEIATTDSNDQASAQDGSRAAARLLEIAAHNADQLVDEARSEATSTVATARAEADQLTAACLDEADQMTASARAEADQLLAAARTEAEQVHAELEQARTQQTVELDQHRATVLFEVAERQTAVEAEVKRLQQLEEDLRSRMRSYLTEQLAQIEPATAD